MSGQDENTFCTISRVITENLKRSKYINLFNIWTKTGDIVNGSPCTEASQEIMLLRFGFE